MKKIMFLMALVVLAWGCAFKPVAVKFSSIKDRDYVLAGAMYLSQGDFKKKWVGVVSYDSESKTPMGSVMYEPKYRVLVDDNGGAMTFGSQMDLLNFFSKHGWGYVESTRIEVRKNVKRDFMLLEKRK